jgi:hypothetical protein
MGDFAYETPPNQLSALRVWLTAHPGSTAEEIAESVYPGKLTAPARVRAGLASLRSRCEARRDGDLWYPAG